MVSVIIGGSGSGKSELAENIAVEINKERLLYIATMQPFDEESRKRIQRHQIMRQEKKFDTIEVYTGLASVKVPQKTTALLECMSNLVANEIFSDFGAKEKTLDAIKHGIEKLTEQTDNLIIVTNNVFEDGMEYDSSTMDYLKILGEINQWITSIADEVIEVVHGISISIKACKKI